MKRRQPLVRRRPPIDAQGDGYHTTLSRRCDGCGLAPPPRPSGILRTADAMPTTWPRLIVDGAVGYHRDGERCLAEPGRPYAFLVDWTPTRYLRFDEQGYMIATPPVVIVD